MITKGLRITKVYFIIFLCSLLPVAFSCTGIRKAKSTAGNLSTKDSLVLKQSLRCKTKYSGIDVFFYS